MAKRKGLPGGLKIRPPLELHRRLKADAALRGVSLSQEAIERLERSYDFADLGGPRLAAILKLVGQAMSAAGEAAAILAKHPNAGGVWAEDAFALDRALTAAIAALEGQRPPAASVTVPLRAENVTAGAPVLGTPTVIKEKKK
jgi:hypothetical protein